MISKGKAGRREGVTTGGRGRKILRVTKKGERSGPMGTRLHEVLQRGAENLSNRSCSKMNERNRYEVGGGQNVGDDMALEGMSSRLHHGVTVKQHFI